MPGPETPPRYRYIKSGVSDDEDEAKDKRNTRTEAKSKDSKGQKDEDSKVLAARKRSGSLGRPLCMSRVLDRQRHGGEQNTWCYGGEGPRFVLQAPPLLKLGQLQTPTLPDPLNPFLGSSYSGYPQTRTFAIGQPFVPQPVPFFQPVPSFDLGNTEPRPSNSPSGASGPSGPSAPSAARRSLSAGGNFAPRSTSVPRLHTNPKMHFSVPSLASLSPPYPPALTAPQALLMAPPGPPAWQPNLCAGALSVPTPSRARRDSETPGIDVEGQDAREKTEKVPNSGHFLPASSFSLGEMQPKMQVRPPADAMQIQMEQMHMQRLYLQRQQEIQQRNQWILANKASQEAQQIYRGSEHRPLTERPGSITERQERPRTRWQLVEDPAVQAVQTERGKNDKSEAPRPTIEVMKSQEAFSARSAKMNCHGRADLMQQKDSAETVAGTTGSGGSLRSSASCGASDHTASRHRILVTGATGLLGRQVTQVLGNTWEVLGVCKRRALPPRIIACDLTQEKALWSLMEHFRPEVVLHLAGEWCPEALRQAPDQVRRLNVDAAGAVAAACEKFKAWLVHMSADCVFDGTEPPYSVESRANPLSEYGWHKLHSEQLVQAACPKAAILRVPLLYGPVESPLDSAVTSLYTDLQNDIREVDAWQRCYPTWAGDVANVLKVMTEMHFSGERIQGIYHWQGNEQFTWHEMMLLVAETSGLDASCISAVHSPPATPLPRDTRLDCSRLIRLLGPQCCHTPLHEGLKQCLTPFRQAPPAMAGRIAFKGKPRAEWTTLTRAAEAGARKAALGDLKGQNAVLQEIFWEELERTRARLQQAGINRKRCAEEKAMHQNDEDRTFGCQGRLDEQRV